MLTDEGKRKLKKNSVLYARMPIHLQIDDSQQHYSQIQKNGGLIVLGEKAPYRYLSHFHPEGYLMFMEGLEFHELASLLYTDFHLFSQVYQEASNSLEQANQAAKAYLNKEIKYRELKDMLIRYVYQTNLPLVLKAIEEGAVENAIGIEYPETWNAYNERDGETELFVSPSKMTVYDMEFNGFGNLFQKVDEDHPGFILDSPDTEGIEVD